MQQPDLWMALPFHVSQPYASPLISTQRSRVQQKPSTAATSYKNGSGGDGCLMWVRVSADIPLLGCSMRIHVPCCFTMEEKQRPSRPSRGGGWGWGGVSRGLRRGEAESLPGVWKGDGKREQRVFMSELLWVWEKNAWLISAFIWY